MTTEKIEHNDDGEADAAITISVKEYERLTRLEAAITSAWPLMWKVIQPTWNQLIAAARDAGFDIPESAPQFDGACTGEPDGPHQWSAWSLIASPFTSTTRQRHSCRHCGFTQDLPL